MRSNIRRRIVELCNEDNLNVQQFKMSLGEFA
jgi:hypothetical protein